MVAVELDRLLQLGGSGDQFPFGGEQAATLIVELGGTGTGLGKLLEHRAGFIGMPGSPEGPGAVEVGVLGVVAGFRGGMERLGGLVPALEVLEGEAPEELGQPVLAELAEVFEARGISPQKDIAHAEAKVDVGRDGPLGTVAKGRDGVAEGRVAGRVASQDFAKVGHGRGVERIAVQERANIGRHQLGHPTLSSDFHRQDGVAQRHPDPWEGLNTTPVEIGNVPRR